jgi:hypothetical protein
MKKRLFLLFFLPFSLCFGISLKEKFAQSKPGTYVVTEQNKTYTLLHVHTLTPDELLLEEISIPRHLVTTKDWKKWVETGAEGHTSWILYAVDLVENQVTECYSFTRQAHLPIQSMDAFLTTLISLNLTFLPEEERLQTGPTSRPGEVGSSKPWGPPMMREGKKVQEASYDVYTSSWPQDQSELSGKKIVLYFDKDHGEFPFPYWMQAREGGLKFKIRATDSGIDLCSPKKSLPRRVPSFNGGMVKEGDKAYFNLNAPLYFHTLKLYAIDISVSPRLTISMPCMMKRDQEHITLEINLETLSEKLLQGHQYAWIVVSEEHDVYAELEQPTLFKGI